MARYEIDPARSFVLVVARSNVHPIHLRGDGVQGHLDLVPEHDGETGSDAGHAMARAAPTGRLSLRVERLRGASGLEDAELRRHADAARFPTIDGLLTSVERLAAGRFRLGGDVTFRGVTRPCTGDVSLAPHAAGAPTEVALRGQATFDIRDFGLEPPRLLLLRVEPEVSVAVELSLVRGAPLA